MSDEGAYALRQELRGHTEDIRCLLVCDLGLVLGSRDATLSLWVEDEAGVYQQKMTYVGHSSYVTALDYLPPASGSSPRGTLVSGSRDTLLKLWDPSTAECQRSLSGHEYQITAVSHDPGSRLLLSASLDSSVRAWDASSGACVRTFEEHKGPVLCLLTLCPGFFVTGSGDRSIKLWAVDSEASVKTLRGHSDSVRALSALGPPCADPEAFMSVSFASASHDGTLGLWTAARGRLATLQAHGSLVYDVAAGADGALASCSEDGTVKIWQRAPGDVGAANVQTIELPGTTWCVSFLVGGRDLAAGSSDRAARLFSRDAARKLPQEAQEALAADVASRRGSSGTAAGQEGAEAGLPPGIKLEDASALTRPGSRPGQIAVVREGGGGVAYSWDAQQSTWERVGEVVSGPGEASAARPRHGGREWDYVFDVDIDDSAPRLKLAINRADNPYDAADRFLQENALPESYRDQVVQFILRNVQDMGIAEGGGRGGVDPYTGASAYRPGASRSPGPDEHAPAGQSATGGGADPYTGARAAGAGSLPQQSGVPCAFEALPAAEGMLRKLRELDAGAEAGLSSAELEGVEGLLRAQCGASSAVAEVVEDGWAGLDVMLARWPPEASFLALDLARLAFLRPVSAQRAAERLPALQGALMRALRATAAPAAQLTALRALANALARAGPGRGWALGALPGALPVLAALPWASMAKNVRGAGAGALQNAAIAAQALAGADWLLDGVLEASASLLAAAPAGEEETLCRALCALHGALAGSARMRARAQGLRPTLVRLRQGGGKTADWAAQLLRVL